MRSGEAVELEVALAEEAAAALAEDGGEVMNMLGLSNEFASRKSGGKGGTGQKE